MTRPSLWQRLYSATKPILFRVEPERAHRLTTGLMRLVTPLIRAQDFHSYGQKTIFDRKVFCPLGLAAGFDKAAAAPLYLYKLGFGFIESGSLTPQPQVGNPKPRLHRLPQQEAMLNKMGFNNPGFFAAWRRLRSRLAMLDPQYLVALSLGKGKDTAIERASDDYAFCLEHLARDPMSEYLFYVAINVSSPNTPALRTLQQGRAIRGLVERCVKISPRPIVVKFAPDFSSDKAFCDSLNMALEGGAQGVIVTNTTTDHSLVALPAQLKNFGGGLSGKPLAEKARNYLRLALKTTKNKVPVIASGGVFSPDEAKLRLDMGAAVVQVYTGLIYYGPDFARDFAALDQFQ